MKFLVDVNIPAPLIRFLLQQGYKVQDARVDYPKAKDIQLIQVAKETGQVILTRDKDFIELTKYPKHKVPVIIIRLTNQQTMNIVNHAEALLAHQTEKVLINSVTIIREEKADSYPLSEL